VGKTSQSLRQLYEIFQSLYMNTSIKTLVIGGVVIGVLLGAYIYFTHGTPQAVDKEVSALTNPVASLIENENLSIGARITLQDELRSFAEEKKADGTLSNYGIYYRELISGPVIALNQEEGFFPASLLKIPVAMWYYKQAETNPDILTQQINFSGPAGISIEHFPPKKTIAPGTIYTVEELIDFMLTESDNDATQILTEFAGGRDSINQVYTDVGIRNVENYETYVIDTHTYAAFFRVLYNAEYLNEDSSEKILHTLTNSSFSSGLTAKLPASIMVAHKFGERTIDVEKGIDQLHDCGVVYAPMNPYLICVMTQGSDYDKMAEFIAEVSVKIYTAATNS
jgi:beta-lactamase class A